MVDPDHLPEYTNSPLVHIERVRANGVEQPCRPQVIVPPGRGELEVEFTAATRIISEGATLLASRRFQREILLMGRSPHHFSRSLTVFEDRVDEK